MDRISRATNSKQCLKQLNIKHIKTTPYNPGGNGLIEIQHRKLKNSLRSLGDFSNWYYTIPLIVLLRNNSLTRCQYIPAQMI